MTTTSVIRDQGVRAIAVAIADRTSFVVTVPPDMLVTVGEALVDVPEWDAYIDNGLDVVLRCTTACEVVGTGTLGSALGLPVAAVVLIPKRVPAPTIAAALGCPVPDDGSRDVLVVGERGAAATAWPALFVDALRLVNPHAAADLVALAATSRN